MMANATDTSAETKQVFQHPLISLIETGFEPHDFNIYIGGTQTARDIQLLKEHNIAIVINCAVNLDINYVTSPKEEQEGAKCSHGTGEVRTFKLGLVDGAGNSDNMMLAGYYILEGAVRQELPEKQSYPTRQKGNVLVHCRGGRSRSTALVALYLHLHKTEKYPTIDAAVAHVREARKLHPEEWFSAPKPMLIESARRAAGIVNMIRASEEAQESA